MTFCKALKTFDFLPWASECLTEAWSLCFNGRLCDYIRKTTGIRDETEQATCQ